MIEVFNVISYDHIFRRNIFYAIVVPFIPFIIIILALTNVPYYHLAKIFSFMAFYYFAYGGLSLYTKKEKSKFVKLVSISYQLFSFAWIAQIINSLIKKENYIIFSGDNPYLIALNICRIKSNYWQCWLFVND